MVTNVPLLTMNEFSAALCLLLEQQTLQYITVPMVNFVYLCPDLYEQVKAAYYQVFSSLSSLTTLLHKVFLVLDLVCSKDDFATANNRESTACAFFALYDNTPVLQYLWYTGFNWDEMTLLNAVKAKSFDCFRFALEKGCPLNILTYKQLVQFVTMYGSREMFCLLVEKQ